MWVLLFSLQVNVRAACEGEAREYATWHDKMEKLAAASQISGAVGGAFAICTFGISMAPCTGLSIAAYDAKCKSDEWKKKLTDCQEREKSRVAEITRLAQLASEKAEGNRQMAIRAKEHYELFRQTTQTKYDKKIKDFMTNYEAQGWDMESDESKEYLKTKCDEIDSERKFYNDFNTKWIKKCLDQYAG